MSTLETNLIQPSTGTTLTLGASGDTITIPSGVTIANSGTATGFGVIAAKIETIAPTTPDVTTTSATYAEVASGLRITHALSNSSNKLIFMFSSTDMYSDGTNGDVGIASTADVTTSVIGNQIMLVKANAYDASGALEVDTMTGIAEYAPGSTSSVTYTPVFRRVAGAASSGTFYINNTVTTARMTFTLMEIA
jgi:hypothetical protein